MDLTLQGAYSSSQTRVAIQSNVSWTDFSFSDGWGSHSSCVYVSLLLRIFLDCNLIMLDSGVVRLGWW